MADLGNPSVNSDEQEPDKEKDVNIESDDDNDSVYSVKSINSLPPSLPSVDNIQTPRISKRKASPLFSEGKKITPMRRSKAAKPKTDTSIVGKMNAAFHDPNFLKSISPSIMSVMSTSIQQAIESAVNLAVSSAVGKIKTDILDQIVESNTKLQATVATQMNLIQEQKTIIDDQVRKLEEKADVIDGLNRKIDDLSSELKSVKLATDDVEQYGRRNSLRFTNLKLDRNLPELELTKQMTHFVNANILKDGSSISESDIDRCHPVGRQILVKFSKYHSKHIVYAAKSNLRGNPGKIFVPEDLTRRNFAIIKGLQPLKKAGKIHSFWSSNGKILVKPKESSRPIKLQQLADIESRLGNPGHASDVD